jgi:NADPH-dependent ferric siderophore reductase
MTTTAPMQTPPSPQPGPLSRALIRMFMKTATITDVETIGEGFRLMTLESPEFDGVGWIPGQKIQIALGSAFVTRTYTPIEWDAAGGRTRILAYALGAGPGSEWVRAAQSGDTCDVFGPRASLDLTGISSPVVIFGDETSFGVALAAKRPGLRCLFETNSTEVCRPVLERLGLGTPDLFARMPQDAHLREIERRLAADAESGTSFVLTGKATSIQRLRLALKVLDVPTARIKTKAYWAPGKTGLD